MVAPAIWPCISSGRDIAVDSKVSQQHILAGSTRLFHKWVEAIPLPDQTAHRITTEIVRHILHTTLGPRNQLRKYHLSTDIGSIWNQQTSCHSLSPCGSMVEHVNRSLLQMLRTYVEQDYEWEWYLPLVLYVYHTAVHTSTGVSLFVRMYGTECRSNDLSPPVAFDTHKLVPRLSLNKASRTAGFCCGG